MNRILAKAFDILGPLPSTKWSQDSIPESCCACRPMPETSEPPLVIATLHGRSIKLFKSNRSVTGLPWHRNVIAMLGEWLNGKFHGSEMLGAGMTMSSSAGNSSHSAAWERDYFVKLRNFLRQRQPQNGEIWLRKPRLGNLCSPEALQSNIPGIHLGWFEIEIYSPLQVQAAACELKNFPSFESDFHTHVRSTIPIVRLRGNKFLVIQKLSE